MRKIKVLSTFIDLETQSTLSLSLLQQLDTTVVVAYLCSLFIRRTLVELKQKQKDERTSRLLSPLLSLVLVIDTEEHGCMPCHSCRGNHLLVVNKY